MYNLVICEQYRNIPACTQVDLSVEDFLVTYVATLTKQRVVDKLKHLNLMKTDYSFNKDAGYYHTEPYQVGLIDLFRRA